MGAIGILLLITPPLTLMSWMALHSEWNEKQNPLFVLLVELVLTCENTAFRKKWNCGLAFHHTSLVDSELDGTYNRGDIPSLHPNPNAPSILWR